MELNIVDFGIIAVIVIGILIGYYKGLMSSVIGIGASILSTLGALLLYRPMARLVDAKFGVVEKLVYYAESLDMLNSVENPSLLNAIETARIPVVDLTPQYLEELLSRISLPRPLGALLSYNVENLTFQDKGITLLGDYLSYTVAYMATGIIMFIVMYVLLRLVFLFISNLTDYMVTFPVLKYADSVGGAVLGVINALLALLVIFLILPVIMAFLPVDELWVLVTSSRFASIFYDGNFLLGFIKGYF